MIVYTARWVFYARLWTPTLLDGWFAAFIVVGVLNVRYAPYPSRGLMMLARPIMGIALYLYLVERARIDGHVNRLFMLMLALGLGIGAAALGATQWTEKSYDLYFIVERLPKINTDNAFWLGGFNPNEIAGAIAWFVPLTLGLTVYAWKHQQHLFQVISAVAFCMLLLALMLGQSRAALAGVFPALFVVIVLNFVGRVRLMLLVGLAALVLVEFTILFNVFPQLGPAPPVPVGLSSRDERTIQQRFDMWESAVEMLTDYPLTGVGMSRYRYQPVRDAYPVPGFDYPYIPDQPDFVRRIIPHTHNEFVQIATDLGFPGFLIYVGWTATALFMISTVWRLGNQEVRLAVVAVGAGLFAHTIYGMADAIPLWDRFSFISWMMLGMVAALYYHVTASKP